MNPTADDQTAEAHDDTDVAAALERPTADGPAFDNEDELPDEDFAGYTDDDVEADES
jgi:hypothetical protein